jgi:dipeptidyl aminopeptidase/acylaminoacyl peptidase
MTRFFSRLLVGVFTCAVTFLSPAQGQEINPLASEFFKKPMFENAVLSPDGKRVAFALRVPGSEFTKLIVLDMQTRAPTVVASFSEVSIGEIFWVNPKRLIFNLAAWQLTGSERTISPGLFAVDANGERFKQLAQTAGSSRQSQFAEKLLPQWARFLRTSAQKDSDDVWVTALEAYDKKVGGDYERLMRVNTVTGRVTDLESPNHAYHWVFDQNNELKAVLQREGRRIQMARKKSNAWAVVNDQDPFEPGVSPAFYDYDGKLYVHAQDPLGKIALYEWDETTEKQAAKPTFSSQGFDAIAKPIFSDKKLLGVHFTADAAVSVWFDPAMKALQAAIDQSLNSTANIIVPPRRPETPWVLVHSFSDIEPSATSAYNTQTQQLVRLGEERPNLKGKSVGVMDFVKYKARDGLEIPAYFTIPNNRPKKMLPLLVWVHGGPFVRGLDWHWHEQIQYLAALGYAVLAPEFRGSAGFGAKHQEAGYKQWGKAMQNDLADGARWAIAQGMVDPSRVCLIGASYGGYAALMGLVNDPDLFKCAVNWVGAADVNLLFDVSWSDIPELAKDVYMTKMMGDPNKDRALFDAVSPIVQAKKIKAPVMLAYGVKDNRVPLVHGEKLRDALKAANMPVDWTVYPDEGHGWANVKTNVDFWTKVDRFLARSIPAK